MGSVGSMRWDSIYRGSFLYFFACFVACARSIQDGRKREPLNIMINKKAWGFSLSLWYWHIGVGFVCSVGHRNDWSQRTIPLHP
ncbi:hypothetical protein HOY82DRAFT_554046 [Tuber indicum]|nr:hypothetical protein HOY82DRAFT_554046 [Tuber indicum]